MNRLVQKYNLLLLVVFMMAGLGSTVANAEVIEVNNQSDFDALSGRIQSLAAKGETEIVATFQKGVYYFKENQINIQDKDWKSLRITMLGNGATIVAQGRDYAAGQAYNGKFSHANGFVSQSDAAAAVGGGEAIALGADVPLWGELHQSSGLVDVYDESTKLCRIRYRGAPNMTPDQCENVYINVTQWFKSNVYKVERIWKGWIYFKVTDLSYNSTYKCQSINLDYGYGKQNPRFRLCNVALDGEQLLRVNGGRVQLPSGVQRVHECLATSFLSLTSVNLQSFSLEGFNFMGNKDSGKYLFNIKSCKMDSLVVADNTFGAIRSGVVQIANSENTYVRNCRFTDCYRNGLYMSANVNTSITGNTFVRQGLAIQNTFCVRSSDQNFLIANNNFEDYGYGAIAAGMWWASEMKVPASGVVEGNQLLYTEAYMSGVMRHSLMDSGAIYLYTQTEGTDVRHNFICNYSGAHRNRGIFCDDGAYNFKIHGNIIVNTPNSYSIDSRRTAGIERNAKSYVKIANVNNSIYDNLIDSSIRFEGRGSDGKCSLGKNYFLANSTTKPQNNVLSNCGAGGEFVRIPYQLVLNPQNGEGDPFVRLQSATYNRLANEEWFSKVSYWLSE